MTEGARSPAGIRSHSAEPGVVPARRSRSRQRSPIARRHRLTGILLTAPAIAALILTVAFPLLWTVSLSLQNFDLAVGGPPPSFAGMDNYARIIDSPAFTNALVQTLGYVATTLAVELAIAMPIAVLLNRETRSRRGMRLFVALPLMIAPVVASLAWKFLFSNGYGLINRGLELIGLPEPSWFADIWLARGTILVTNAWLALPFVVLVLLAGLATIPTELIEAARTDGANRRQIFVRIILPLLRPALLIILVIRLADAFRMFDAVYVLTGGGPGNATEVMSSYLYRLLFTSADFAGGAAAVVLFVAVIALSALAIFAVLRPKEERA